MKQLSQRCHWKYARLLTNIYVKFFLFAIYRVIAVKCRYSSLYRRAFHSLHLILRIDPTLSTWKSNVSHWTSVLCIGLRELCSSVLSRCWRSAVGSTALKSEQLTRERLYSERFQARISSCVIIHDKISGILKSITRFSILWLIR
jgi:hypothetical protein